jgi:hypothetical protein
MSPGVPSLIRRQAAVTATSPTTPISAINPGVTPYRRRAHFEAILEP